MVNPAVSILIVTYNGAQTLGECLRAVVGDGLAPACEHEILILDNASTDNAVLVAESALGVGSVVRSSKNLGFGRGVNELAKSAMGQYLLLLNPDAIVKPGAIDSLVEYLVQYPECGLVGGKIVNDDGSVDPRSCFRKISLWSLFCFATGLSSGLPESRFLNPEKVSKWARRKEPFRVDIISGGFLLIRADLFSMLEGFDERFWLYGEDQDLCLRALRAGFAPTVIPHALVQHRLGGSSSSDIERHERIFRGRATIVCQHFGAFARVGMLLMQTGVLLRCLLETSEGKRGKWYSLWMARTTWRDGWQSGSEREI